MSDASDGVVSTTGVTSHVFRDVEQDAEDVDEHVLLVDFDGASIEDVASVAQHLEGAVAVLESSSGSYHLWCLSVDSLREHVLTALSYSDADDAHAGASLRRGYSVLRLVSKVRDAGGVYKERPTLRFVLPPEQDAPEQSAGHFALLESIARERESDVDAADVLEARERSTLVGLETRVRTDSYMTVDDATKAVLRGDRGDRVDAGA